MVGTDYLFYFHHELQNIYFQKNILFTSNKFFNKQKKKGGGCFDSEGLVEGARHDCPCFALLFCRLLAHNIAHLVAECFDIDFFFQYLCV